MKVDKKDDKWFIQLRKGVFELAILSLLKSKQMYGYEISKFLKEVPTLSISEGAIYPILKRMSEEGWIDYYWVDSSGGPKRKYYQITTKGEKILEYRLTQYEEIHKVLLFLGEGGVNINEKP
ncbi:PadR family transcriptional regulator [Neobacillus sedimentimangrovi]|jgi:PadR family transcriptional regulator, regulatory protein PadR|uniref:PadR family transcriptional regulator n=1 Tax=Neobacillus sedimentimangrovi TaxID=2699460 RepID=A0ABS8QIF1_9BACI|nr:PadR family transcriptional regulator [Neobacillus sedimentimangrovi]AIM15143.1 DNA-binding protein [Bacillus sp. X1(2014)]MCD4839046.1 PadR family transcriptional regulator [Neobacillus sedimentimangrovi]